MLTDIEVPVELRDRLAAFARRRHETMAEAVDHALDAAEEAEFWAKARATMGTAPVRVELQRESERFATNLKHELEPEDWIDIPLTVSTERLVRRVGVVDSLDMMKIELVLRRILGLT